MCAASIVDDPVSAADNLEEILRHAYADHQRGDLSAAEVGYQRILQSDSQHFNALQLLATIAVQRKDSAAALAWYEKALATNPLDANSIANRGIARLNLQHYEQALADFDQAITLQPNYAQTYSHRGTVLRKLDRDDEALTSFNQALALKPDFADAHLNLGNLLFARKKQSDALSSFEQAIALNPNYLEAILSRGKVLYSLRRYAEALVAFDQVLSQAAQHVGAHFERGNALCAMRRFTDAITAFDALLTLDPHFANAWFRKGDALRELNLPIEAAASYRNGLKLMPENVSAHNNLGVMMMQLGHLDQAVSAMREGLACLVKANLFPAELPMQLKVSLPDYEWLLWQVLMGLASAEVHAFATAGTLLGLERDGHLLPFDKDLDIGVPFAEMTSACTWMASNGWTETPNPMRLANPRSFVHDESGLTIDLFAFQLDNVAGKLITGFWQCNQPWSAQRVTEFPAPLKLQRVQRAEGYHWALANPQEWLEALYGDWRTPDHDFDTVIAAKNLRGFATLTRCFAFNRIARKWQSGQLRKALAGTRHCLRHLPEDELLQQVENCLASALATPDLPRTVPVASAGAGID